MPEMTRSRPQNKERKRLEIKSGPRKSKNLYAQILNIRMGVWKMLEYISFHNVQIGIEINVSFLYIKMLVF